MANLKLFCFCSVLFFLIDSFVSSKELNRRNPDSESIFSFGKCRPRYDAIPPIPLAGTRRSAKSSSRLRECSRTTPVSKLSPSSLLKRSIDSSDNEDGEQHPSDVKVSERPLKRIRTEVDSYLHSDLRMPSCSKPVVEPVTPAPTPPSSMLSKWRSPRTSPLGPRTSKYRRRSRQSSQPARTPTKANLNLAMQCVLRAFQHE